MLLFVAAYCILISSCKNNEIEESPAIPYKIELNGTEFHNGDSLFGRVIIDEKSLIQGTVIEKIDCRLGNIVIGTVANDRVCPFGTRLIDKPIGIHTLSLIIKCKTPGYDETFWRYDLKTINIKQ